MTSQCCKVVDHLRQKDTTKQMTTKSAFLQHHKTRNSPKLLNSTILTVAVVSFSFSKKIQSKYKTITFNGCKCVLKLMNFKQVPLVYQVPLVNQVLLVYQVPLVYRVTSSLPGSSSLPWCNCLKIRKIQNKFLYELYTNKTDMKRRRKTLRISEIKIFMSTSDEINSYCNPPGDSWIESTSYNLLNLDEL